MGFLEIISFGEFVNFYRFYCNKYHVNSLNSSILYSVKDLRNAAAHNNCIIHNLNNKADYFKKEIVNAIHEIITILRQSIIQNKLKNDSIQNFVAMLIALYYIIKIDKSKIYLLDELSAIFDKKMIENKYLYKSAPKLKQSYSFCKKIINEMKINLYNNITK